jgi:hypothetical protein
MRDDVSPMGKFESFLCVCCLALFFREIPGMSRRLSWNHRQMLSCNSSRITCAASTCMYAKPLSHFKLKIM